MTKRSLISLRGKIHVKHGFPFKGEHFKKSGPYVVLTPGNFHERGGFKRNAEKDKCYAEPFPQEYLLKKDDIVVAMTEQTDGLLGSMAIIPESGRFLHNQRLGFVTSLSCDVLVEFLYHVFKTQPVREQIRRSASGSKVKHTSPERLYDVQVPLPSPKEQASIASFLSLIEKKIELNQRLNEELEGMAKLLYDYWFVQHDFPISAAQAAPLGKPELAGHPYRTSGGPMTYHETLKREIPQGWVVIELSALFENVRETVSPEDVTLDTPYVGLEHVPRRQFVLDAWDFAGSVTSLKSRFKTGDFLFGKLRPYFHKVVRVAMEGICTSELLVLRAKQPKLEAFLGSVIFSDVFVESTSKQWGGAQMPRAEWNRMKEFKVPCPPDNLLELFNEKILPLWNLGASNQQQIQHLTALRDWLLPMLMNGQVTVR